MARRAGKPSRRAAAAAAPSNAPVGQRSMWACPRDGHTFEVEETGLEVTTRVYGRRRVMRFYDSASGHEVTVCPGCSQRLHWLYNRQGSNGLELE
jgi:hypothetical protein